MRIREKKILAGIAVAVAMLYKPTMLGANLTPLAMILTALLAGYYCWRQGWQLQILKSSLTLLISIAAYYIYRIIHAIVLSGQLDVSVLKATGSVLFFVGALSVLLADRDIRRLFVKGFILLLVFFVCSYLLSLPFFFFLDYSVYALEVFGIDIPRYGYHFAIYFPLTPATGRWTILDIQFLRLSALFRECGIAQLFYIWAFSECEHYFQNAKKIKILLFLGVIFCFSTAGYICLIAFLGLKLVLSIRKNASKQQKKALLYVGIPLVVAVVAFTCIPGISIWSKNPESLLPRLGSLPAALEAWSKHFIFGSLEMEIESTGNSMFQLCYRIGLVGLLLYYGIYVVALKNAADKRRFILANVAALLTLSLSQNIYDAPLVYLLILLPYGEEAEVSLSAAQLWDRIKSFKPRSLLKKGKQS